MARVLIVLLFFGFLSEVQLSAQSTPVAPAPVRPFREGCTDRDLIGSWGFLGAGSVLASPVNGLAGPFSRVGKFVSDGAGHLTFSSRAAFNGIHFHQDFSGTYTMRSDCTFTAFVTLPFSHPSIESFVLHSTFHGVISDQGKEMVDLFINPQGVTIFGRARKQSISQCTVRDLFGSYLFDQSGSTLDLGFPIPFGSLGRLDADGNGKMVGDVVHNSGGFAVPGNLTGTYTVESDCTFDTALCFSSKDDPACIRNYTHHGVLLDNGDAAYMIVTSPLSSIILGNLKRQ